MTFYAKPQPETERGRCPMNPTALCLALGLSLLTGCASERPLRTPDVAEAVRSALAAPQPAAKSYDVPASISAALAEPLPPMAPPPPEARLDLLVNNAQARDVFLAIVADTRYSMLMHPDVTGSLSVTLRGVTVLEALEAIRDVYGYDFKMEGRRITIYGPTLQTRIFNINYPHATRDGKSDLRVASGTMPSSSGATPGAPGAQNTSTGSVQSDSSSISTSSKTDLWEELAASVCAIIGSESTKSGTGPDAAKGTCKPGAVAGSGGGRSVITSPQAGLMLVRAMPDELREVEKFLKAAQVAVERQVMLEAKIVEVELRDGFQSGIDWSALRNSGKYTGAIGSVGSAAGIKDHNVLIDGVTSNVPGLPNGITAGAVSLPAAGGGLFGLALATEGFQAVLGFLETRGDVQILSSPRIATMNNQKALLKVGVDEYFVTGFTASTNTTATTGTNTNQTNAAPTPNISSMFSGIALDVMPQIDNNNNITLHIRPSVTSIVEKNMSLNLGTTGNFQLPLASRSVNESDTIVRIQDGNIVAIGGLMQMESSRKASGLPGSGDSAMFSSLLGNKSNAGRKKELVVLIKPTIIRSAQDWEQQTRRSREALDDMDVARSRVIRLDGNIETTKPKSTEQ